MNILPQPSLALYPGDLSGAVAAAPLSGAAQAVSFAASKTVSFSQAAPGRTMAADAGAGNGPGRLRVPDHTSAVALSSLTAKAAMPRRCPTNINLNVGERNIGAASGARRQRPLARSRVPVFPRVLATVQQLGRRQAWAADAIGLAIVLGALLALVLIF